MLPRGLTFELTPTTEVGTVRLVRDDAPSAADQPYSACRSGSALNEGLGLTVLRPLLVELDLEDQLRCAMRKPGF